MNVTSFLHSLKVKVLSSELVKRAAHTFMQAFLAVWLVNGLSVDKVALTAGVAAGVSAVKTMILTYLEGRRG